MFNERLSKTNQYLKQRSSHNFNCIIFGSSRTTLLNESQLGNPYRCFNFSFSGGRIKEFVAFAKWVKNKGENPDYLILGIDDFNFVQLNEKLNIPDFIKFHSDPPSVFYSYFSLDALDMSFRLFTQTEINPKIYDQEFLGTVVQDPPKYRPNLIMFQHTLNKHIVNDYQDLRDIFPRSVLIGYIPPVSSWVTASKSEEELDFFLHSVYTMTTFFDAIYDFSIPSKVTNNPENTYDGSHYFPNIQKEISKAISGEPMTFGIQVKNISREAYIKIYLDKIHQFRETLN